MIARRAACSLVAVLLVLGCTLSNAATATPPATASPSSGQGASPTGAPATGTPGHPATQSATAAATTTAAAVTTAAPPRPTRTPGAPRPNSVDNGNILLQLRASVNQGVSIADICDDQANVDYISPDCAGARSIPLFEFAVDAGSQAVFYPSDTGLAVSATQPGPGGAFSIAAAARDVPLAFTIDVSAPAGGPAAIIHLKARNTSQQPIVLRLVLPRLAGLQNISSPDMWAAVPQEIGSVGPLNDPQSFASQGTFGMKVDPRTGLPHAMSSMDLAAIYNHRAGGGLFFASLDNPALGGVAPIQFNLDAREVAGYWSAPLDAGQAVDLPGLAIGVFPSGDWHTAVDYYVGQNKANWTFPQIPAWFRDQGAIYSFSGGGAGSIYLDLPVRGDRAGIPNIQSFEDLPQYLTEAKALGTNIVYIDNYWEDPATGQGAYENKGDYLPRSDWGGAAAFKDGIAKIHQQGGRIILYLEPFIINKDSQIGMQNGAQWEGHDPFGDFDRKYPANYKMVAPFGPWQDYLIGVAQRLVRDYGADGIFLDSYSWQLNWQVRVGSSRQYYSPQAYNLGVLQLTRRLRAAIQAIKPDAVVLGETTAGPIAQVWDGGLSADFARAWGAYRGPSTKLVAAPVRYGLPQVNFISNGTNLNELYQVYAAGENLALCCDWAGTFMNQNANQIRTLVGIRQQYKDALIYGQQDYQPQTDNVDIAAYDYAGADHQILTVVNTADTRYSGTLTLRASDADSHWQDLIGGGSDAANGTSLAVSLAAGGILVLLRQS